MTRTPRGGSRIRPGTPVLAGALIGAALLLAACSSSSTPATTTGPSPTTTAVGPTTTGAPATTTTTTTTASSVRNLVATAQVKADLAAAFVAMKQVPASDVTGTEPGSVYYAYEPTTSTYWAYARFDLSPAATQSVEVGWQDGGGDGLFKMDAGSPWSVQSGGEPAYCAMAAYFPPAVLAAWSIAAPTGLTC